MLFTIDVLDTWRRPVPVEVMIRRETVELRCQDRLAGITDRDHLRTWLTAPFGVLAYDDCSWLHLTTGIALCIDDIISPCVLSDHVIADLRSRL
jgi:hypothetical protein